MCGAHAVRGIAGDRISAAAEELGIELAEESEPPPPMKAEAG